jgi:hypothetical protein
MGFVYGDQYLTDPRMKSARRVHKSNSLVDRAAYAGVEGPPEFHSRRRLMERAP